MNVVGVIVEYNPFHYGHLHHLVQTKKKLEADIVIAVMSTHFTQRGEPVITNKWERTKIALQSGVDLVVELPFIYGVHSADYFAKHAMFILDNLFCNMFCFGSETNQLSHLQKIAKSNQHIMKNPQISLIKRANNDTLKANDILGTSYLLAIETLNSHIKPFTIQRTNDFHDLSTTQKHASASAIRHALKHNDSYEDLTPMINLTYRNLNHYLALIRLQFITARQAIKDVIHCDEGIDFLIEKYIFKVENVDQLLECCSNKKYTKSRIARALVHILCMSNKNLLIDYPNVPYLRILGATQNGLAYLNKIKKELNLPLITTVSNFNHPILSFECHVTKIWSLIDKNILNEYQIPLIINET